MLSLHKPSAVAIQTFREAQAKLGLSYGSAGITAGTPPPGYVADHTRVLLGKGEHVYLAARAALARWEHFRLGWVEAMPASTPIREGEVVAILARLFGVWWLNACRIVQIVDRAAPTTFGFAYGTLPDHAESGEERFQVEWQRDRDEVWYDILALSRPHHWLTWLGYPLARRMQRRFARDSAAAMRRGVAGPS